MRSKRVSSTEDRGNISDAEYWDSRYSKRLGGSGDGSMGRLLSFKAHTYNMLAQKYGWDSVIDVGCGTGNIINLIEYGVYLGYDISEVVISKCKEMYKPTSFRQFATGPLSKLLENARARYDVALSFDVTFHITNQADYESYMNALAEIADNVLLFTPNENMDAMRKYLDIDDGHEFPGHVFYRNDVEYLVKLGMTLREVVPCPFDSRNRNQAGNTFSRFFLLSHD